jgi:hypothetical protein
MVISESPLFIEQLIRTHRSAARIDIRDFEEGAPERIRHELLPAVRELVEEGLALVEEAARHFEAAPSSPQGVAGEGMLGWDLLVREVDTEHVADLAYLARLELKGEREALAITLDLGADEILARCDASLRRLRRATAAIEKGIAELEGQSSRLEQFSYLDQSRQVRREYAHLRREVGGAEPRTASEVERALSKAAVAIEHLITQAVWRELRVSDRRELRSFLGRLRVHLATAGGDAAAGRHLWQDLQAFAALLQAVNRRAELVEHDRRVIAESFDELRGLDPPPPALPLRHRQRLARLQGRDDELDRLLAAPQEPALDDWVAVLGRLRQEMGTPVTVADLMDTDL